MSMGDPQFAADSQGLTKHYSLLLISSQHGNCEGSYSSSYIISQQQYVVVHLHLA
jgi:hypothetical protein